MQIEYSQQKSIISKKIIKYIFITGLIAGTLDISSAFINFMIATGGKNPVRVLYFISSGVFGRFAFSGGVFYAISGLVFHFIIAYSFTTFYFLMYPRVLKFSKNKFLNGTIFGIITWLVMNLVVVPLSNTPPINRSLFQLILGVLFLVFFIGFPAAISANRYYLTE